MFPKLKKKINAILLRYHMLGELYQVSFHELSLDSRLDSINPT
jgi:hypothetical protein